jgi:hypothetical protein
MKLKFFISVFIVLLAGFNSCTKSDMTEAQMKNISTVSDRTVDPLSVQAFSEAVTDEYEIDGSLVYTHLRYNFATVAPEKYLPSIARKEFSDQWNAAKIAYEGKSAQHLLNELQENGKITANQKTLFLDLVQLITNIDESSSSFGNAWYQIRNWEQSVKNNVGVSEDEKEILLVQASAARNLMKFQYEVWGVDDRGKECSLGIKNECWKAAGLTLILDTLKGLLGGVFDDILGAKGNFITVVGKATAKAAGVSAVFTVTSLYLNKDCKCGNDTSLPPSCSPPLGISLLTGECSNPLRGKAAAWGFVGTGTFFWVVENGTFPENGGGTTATTIQPVITVLQNNVNTPIDIAVTFSCASGNTVVTKFDIPVLTNAVGSMSIAGPQTGVQVSSTNVYTYLLTGGWTASINSIIDGAWCSPHGQIQETGLDFVKIKWTSIQPVTAPAWLAYRVKNICTGQTRYGTFPVTLTN